MTPISASCRSARSLFSGYMDGGISGRQMQAVAAHLDTCTACTAEFESWRSLQQVLGSVGPVKPPADLGLKLRLAISHEAARRRSPWYGGLPMRWDNFFRPLMLQAAAGLAGAMLLVGGAALLVGVVGPGGVQANDEPLGALTAPHYLYSAAGRQPIITPQDGTIVVEAKLNARGRVYDYKIISGPSDPYTEAQVLDQLVQLVYQPASAFGAPVRGEVLITFSGVSVHG